MPDKMACLCGLSYPVFWWTSRTVERRSRAQPGKERMQEQNRLTEGNIYKALLAFGLPYLIANFIQALYGAVDLAVVGWFNNAETVAGVSVGTQVTQMLNSLISGLTLGGTILIAQYVGARRQEDTRQTIGTMLSLFALAAVGFMLAMFALTPAILQLVNTPAESMEQAKQYVYICSGGILFIFGYNAISAILRGLGDSKRPVLFIGIACVTNIVLDVLLVGGLGWGAAGAAVATVFSQGVSLVLAVILLRRREDFVFDFSRESIRIHGDKVRSILRLGLPVSLQETILSFSFLAITAIVNSMGYIAAAATGICGKFDSFAMLPASAFSGALSAFTGQNMGAGRPDRAIKALRTAIVLALLCSLFFFAWAQLWPASILHIFKASDEVTLAGTQYIRTFSFDFMLVAFGFCFNGFFNGCGRTLFVMVVGSAASVGIRLPLAWFLSRAVPGNLTVIGMAAPVATLVSVVISLLYLRRGKWRELKL